MRFVVVPVAICTSYGKSNSLAIPKFAECKKIWWIMSRVGAERWNIPICRSKNVLTQLHMHVCFHFRVLLQLYIQLHVLPINKGEASIYDLRTYNPPPTSPAVMLHQLHHITTMPTCSRNRPKTLPPKNWSFARVGRPQEKISQPCICSCEVSMLAASSEAIYLEPVWRSHRLICAPLHEP